MSRVRGVAAAMAVLCLLAAPALAEAASGPESSVVGLEVAYQQWDGDQPWAKENPGNREPSGVAVAGPFILTSAQMLADATYIQMKKFGRSVQIPVRIHFVDREVNLGLLAVDDPEFWEDIEPVRLAAETPTRGVLRTVRWNRQQFESLPTEVKRYEVQDSHFGDLQHAFLLAKTDMSGGGWSEPVFVDGKLVGLTVSQNESRAKILPVEIIRRFLEMAASAAPYPGFPVLGAKWQVNEDRALAAFLGQTDAPRGVLIRQVPWGTSACGVLEPLDLLLSLNGNEVDAEGFYTHPRWGRLDLANILMDGHEAGDEIPIRVLRGGRELALSMTLREYATGLALIPAFSGEGPPPYAVAGGFIFRELDGGYLRTWGKEWTRRAPLSLVTRYFLEREAQRQDRRRIILLTAVLPSTYNLGYQDLRDEVVESINGRPVDSIPALVEALRHADGEFHIIRLAADSGRQEIVLDAAGLAAATAAVLQDYGIPAAVRPGEPPVAVASPNCAGQY